MYKWDTKKLGDLIDLNPDSIANGFDHEKIKYVDISSVGTGIQTDEPTEYKVDDAPSRAKRVVKSGDTILSTVRPNRRSFLYVKNPRENLVVSTGFAVLRPKVDNLDKRYLYYAINDQKFTDFLANNAKGAAYPAVDNATVKRAKIPLPDLDTQQKIASILSAFDELIENNSRRIEILEEMARRIYREWFVHFRYPGHEDDDPSTGSGQRLVDSGTELGEIPEGWEVKSVIDLYDTSAGGTPSRKKEEYFDGSIPWIKTKELNDSFIQGTEETITKLGLDNSSAKLFPKNSVLVAMYGATVGQLGILGMDATTNQACCAVMEKEEPFDYSYIFLSLLEYRDKLIGLKQGAAQQNINQGIIKEFKILKPPTEILKKFQKKLYPLFDQIRVLKKKNDRLKETRDLLLPKLISGKIDIEKNTIN